MSDYDWRKWTGNQWRDRFPRQAIGYVQWQEYWRSYLPEGKGTPLDSLMSIWDDPKSRSLIQCPRLFISHRQSDDQLARRIAWMAKQEGFDYWLDVEDPILDALGMGLGSTLTYFQRSIGIACVIEMALLNCSHVAAVISPATQQSRWVPYEFGRVKDKRLISLKAGSWVHPKLDMSQLLEYLHLGKLTDNEVDLKGWLRDEFTNWTKRNRCCSGGSTNLWNGAEPPALSEA